VNASNRKGPNTRLIPRLDVKGTNLVKGIHLEGLRVLGQPADFARAYYLEGADELLFVDIVASLYQRNQLLPLILETAKEMYIPLTVAGGLRSLDDIRGVLRAGADKAALNTAAIRRPDLITEAALAFGSSTVVVSIEAKKRPDGRYEAYTDCGRERTGRDVEAWAREAETRGAGEILVTSIDREGTGGGFDVALVETVTNAVSVPVVASGGAGSKEDVVDVVQRTDISGVALASLLHYDFISRHGASQPPAVSFSRIAPASMEAIRASLASAGCPTRVPCAGTAR
jgi:imidazole glycerol-phosphate synthase subunit HisF